MTTPTEQRTYTIDATGKRLGIIATEAARVLLGKDQTDFARNTVADVVVTIENANKLDIPEHKKSEIYQTFSGYPGGRREETLERLADRRGIEEVVFRTVSGMLPNNRLKKPRLKNLIITK